MKIKQTAVTLVLLALGGSLVTAVPLSSAFTYQGQLYDGTNAANGIYDFTLQTLRRRSRPTRPLTGRLPTPPSSVVNGLFTATPGVRRSPRSTGKPSGWRSAVRTNGSAADFVVFEPRQPLTASPYALYAANSGTLGGQLPSLLCARVRLDGLCRQERRHDDGHVEPAGQWTWWPAANQLVLSGGKVGIGTTSPSSTLDVRSAGGDNYGGLQVLASDTAFLRLNPSLEAGAYNPITRLGDAGLIYGKSGAGNGLVIAPNTVSASGIRLDPDGKVGIGMPNPNATLDVVGNVRATTYYNFNGNPPIPTSNVSTIFEQSNTGPTVSGLNIDLRTGNPPWSDMASRMLIDSLGRVGIGTTTPGDKLVVNGRLGVFGTGLDGSLYQRFVLYAENSGLSFDAPKDSGGNKLPYHFKWRGDEPVAMTILGNGNVGIGTTTPTVKLDVAGTVKATDVPRRRFPVNRHCSERRLAAGREQRHEPRHAFSGHARTSNRWKSR